MNATTRPDEKAVFFIALIGVVAASLAITLIPANDPAPTADSGQPGTSSATSRPTSRPVAAARSSTSTPATISNAPGGSAPSSFPLSAYADLLTRYLKDGRVDYAGMSVDGRPQLQELVDAIENTDASQLAALRDADYIAWYINAYNILTLKTIVDHHPVASIMDIDQPWDTKWPVAGESLTLNEIEHSRLRLKDEPRERRAAFVDPRIHFALNCASIGCPNLQSEPYTAANLESLLEKGARDFTKRGDSFRIEGNTLHLSELLDWYGEDFTLLPGASPDSPIAVQQFFAKYITDPETRTRLEAGEYEIEWSSYDWGLNGS